MSVADGSTAAADKSESESNAQTMEAESFVKEVLSLSNVVEVDDGEDFGDGNATRVARVRMRMGEWKMWVMPPASAAETEVERLGNRNVVDDVLGARTERLGNLDLAAPAQTSKSIHDFDFDLALKTASASATGSGVHSRATSETAVDFDSNSSHSLPHSFSHSVPHSLPRSASHSHSRPLSIHDLHFHDFALGVPTTNGDRTNGDGNIRSFVEEAVMRNFVGGGQSSGQGQGQRGERSVQDMQRVVQREGGDVDDDATLVETEDEELEEEELEEEEEEEEDIVFVMGQESGVWAPGVSGALENPIGSS